MELADVLSTGEATWKWLVYYKLHTGYSFAFLRVCSSRISVSVLELQCSKKLRNHRDPQTDLVEWAKALDGRMLIGVPC